MADTNQYIDTHKGEIEKAIDFFKKEIAEIRTGRANTSMVENVQVQAYDQVQPLSQVASLAIADAHTIQIEPWDKTILKDVEAALARTSLGLSVVNTGERLMAKIPTMTEESRKEMVKILGKKAEEARIKVRQVRDDIKEEIQAAEKANDLTEDDKYLFITQLDNTVSDYTDQISKLQEEKEKEIMTV